MNQAISNNIEALVVKCHPGQGCCKIGAAVVAIVAGNNFLFGFLTETIKIKMDHSNGSIIRHRPPCTKLNMV